MTEMPAQVQWTAIEPQANDFDSWGLSLLLYINSWINQILPGPGIRKL